MLLSKRTVPRFVRFRPSPRLATLIPISSPLYCSVSPHDHRNVLTFSSQLRLDFQASRIGVVRGGRVWPWPEDPNDRDVEVAPPDHVFLRGQKRDDSARQLRVSLDTGPQF